jgi:beta-N-acetylhexosaminidase
MKKSNGFLFADVEGLTLTSEDKEILAHPFISGVILFSRNYESIEQLRELAHQIKLVSPKLIITVDQEGGRVQRFRTGFTELPAMGTWGERYVHSPEETKKEFALMLGTMVNELRNVGIDSTLVPVLDIDYDRNTVIGHRSFGNNKNIVMQLSEFMVDQFHTLRSPVTGKHFPGHGWVTLDSHFHLPIDERSFEEIAKHDLYPFSQLSKKLDAIMLAHVVYENIDPLPVCFSRFWINDILREQLQYDGLIMSDDLSMQAVAKMCSYEDRARRALEAGCDILLACNSRAGVVEVLDRVVPNRNEQLARRLSHYARFI